MVRLLLQYGANKALLNKCDMTPVQLADRLRVRSARARARAAAARALTVWPRARSTSRMDYYDELGLTASATDLDIKKACVPARRARPRRASR